MHVTTTYGWTRLDSGHRTGRNITVRYGGKEWGLEPFLVRPGEVPEGVTEVAMALPPELRPKLLEPAAKAARDVASWQVAVREAAQCVDPEPTRRAMARAQQLKR